MSESVITTLAPVGRWEPNADGRLMRAALELYSERGFEQTTVADIAERAGVTERTFFRYFADKREVLFGGSSQLQQAVVETIAAAPDVKPIEIIESAIITAASIFQEGREHSQRR